MVRLADADSAGRNLLREELPLPVCVLRVGALERNVARFQRFSDAAGVLLCPHAKTSMGPALFGRQLAAAAWGLTFATIPQVQVARRHGSSESSTPTSWSVQQISNICVVSCSAILASISTAWSIRWLACSCLPSGWRVPGPVDG